MIFLNPAYLWALLGLAVPVAIHLWSRKEGRTIKIGSIELLREKDPKRSSSISPNEFWLLLLRMLAITLLVFILAEPRLTAKTESSPITYLVEPSLLSQEDVVAILDTLDPEAVRLLQPGFPKYQNENLKEVVKTPHYWQLAAEMDVLKTDSIVVFTRALVSGLKGKRPPINQNINWVIINPEETGTSLLSARMKGDEVVLTSVAGDHQILKFEEERLSLSSEGLNVNAFGDSLSVTRGGTTSQFPLHKADPIKILLVHNDSLNDEIRILQATYSAIGEYLEQTVEVDIVQEENIPEEIDAYSTLIWLNNKQVMKTEVSTIIYRPDSLANSLLEESSNPNQYYLTQPLDPENIIEHNFPEKLLDLLQLDKNLEEKLPFFDKRVIDLKELQPVLSEGISKKNIVESSGFSHYLWLILLAVLLAERGLAYLRKQ